MLRLHCLCHDLWRATEQRIGQQVDRDTSAVDPRKLWGGASASVQCVRVHKRVAASSAVTEGVWWRLVLHGHAPVADAKFPLLVGGVA